MNMFSDEDWDEIMLQADEFDMNTYQKEIKEMHELPEYIEWFKSRPQAVQDAFKAIPFEGFYTDKETKTSVYRIYGVAEMEDGSITYHACSAHIGWTNDVIGGISADAILQVDKWSDVHLKKIRMNNAPQYFLLPSGWIQFSMSQG
jgi:hypothetical protein